MTEITRHDVGLRMSQAVEHAGLVYLAGQVADDPDADVTIQTRQVLAKIDRLLGECGTDKSRLLWAQLWVTDMRNFAAMNEVYITYFQGMEPPARSAMAGSGLALGAKVEIECIARGK